MNDLLGLKIIDQVPVPKEKVLQAYTKGDGLQKTIDKTRAIVESFEHDLSTDAGRKRTASLAHGVSKLKVYLDGIGKDLVTDWKQQAKVVDASRKSMRDQLEDIRDVARAPLTEWEAAESKRVAAIQDRIASIKRLATVYGDEGRLSLESMRYNLASLEINIIDESYQEFANEAAIEKDKSIGYLKEAIAERVKHEAEQAELERLRQEKAVRKQKAYEVLLKREAARAAKLKAEKKAQKEKDALAREKQEALDREEKAIQDKIDAERETIVAEEKAKLQIEQAAKQAKIDTANAAEHARVAEIKRRDDEELKEKLAQDERKANEKHVKGILQEAADALESNGVASDIAMFVLSLINDNKIPNVKIEF